MSFAWEGCGVSRAFCWAAFQPLVHVGSLAGMRERSLTGLEPLEMLYEGTRNGEERQMDDCVYGIEAVYNGMRSLLSLDGISGSNMGAWVLRGCG